MTMDREAEAEKKDQEVDMRPTSSGGQGARPFVDIENQETAAPMSPRSRSRRRKVSYQNQDVEGDEHTPALEFEGEASAAAAETGMLSPHVQFLTPDHPPEIGIGTSGKRAYVDGIAVPFRLKKTGAETASMMTLNSEHSQQLQSPRASTTRPMSSSTVEAIGGGVGEDEGGGDDNGNSNDIIENKNEDGGEVGDVAERPLDTPSANRPGLETFQTAAENLPTSKGA